MGLRDGTDLVLLRRGQSDGFSSAALDQDSVDASLSEPEDMILVRGNIERLGGILLEKSGGGDVDAAHKLLKRCHRYSEQNRVDRGGSDKDPMKGEELKAKNPIEGDFV